MRTGTSRSPARVSGRTPALLAVLAAVVAAGVYAASTAAAPPPKSLDEYYATIVRSCEGLTSDGCRCVVVTVVKAIPFEDFPNASKAFVTRVVGTAIRRCGGASIERHDEMYAVHLPGAAEFSGRSVRDTRLSLAAYDLSKLIGSPK